MTRPRLTHSTSLTNAVARLAATSNACALAINRSTSATNAASGLIRRPRMTNAIVAATKASESRSFCLVFGHPSARMSTIAQPATASGDERAADGLPSGASGATEDGTAGEGESRNDEQMTKRTRST